MSVYQEAPTAARSWRLIVLMGANTRTYKFALASALLESAKSREEFVSIEDLARRYSLSLLARPADAKQRTGNRDLGSQDFLRVLDEEREDSVSGGEPTGRLLQAAIESMPDMVMQKFHNLIGGSILDHSFYEIIGVGKTRGVRLSSSLHDLAGEVSAQTLSAELDARWTIVERAWDAGIGPGLLARGPILDESGNMLLDPTRRISVATSRDSLIGFQAGRCFYCRAPIPKDFAGTHVDHVFPFALMARGAVTRVDLNGIWNLVVACQGCNLTKSASLPSKQVVGRLFQRNEAILNSPYPLKRAIEFITGKTPGDRQKFLNSVLTELG